MAVTYGQSDSGNRYGGGYSRFNQTNHTYFPTAATGMPSGPAWADAKFDKTVAPYSLGSGVYVDATGRYLMPPTVTPVEKFVVINDSVSDIYVGVNIPTSGTWATGGIGGGLTIEGGASYEFGAAGSDDQIIRNVWAISSAGLQHPIQGYAMNQREWV